MSLGFGHLIGAWAQAKLVEWYRKKPFSGWIWGFFLFGAILPDADFLLEWFHIFENVHRTFTNSLIAIPLYFTITYLVVLALQKYSNWVPKNETAKYTAIALTLGTITHTIADAIFYPGVNLLWPFDWWFAAGEFYFATEPLYERIGGTLSQLNKTHLFILDMGMGTAWFFYFLIRGRLKP